MGGEPVTDERESALRLQLVTGARECQMEPVHPVPQLRIVQNRAVDRAPDEVHVDLRGVQVQDALAETVGRDRVTVVRDVRRQECHHGTWRTVFMAVQVVADHALVDEEQRPGIVRVHGVGVVGEAGVEDLVDPLHPRTPRSHLWTCGHPGSVQARPGA